MGFRLSSSLNILASMSRVLLFGSILFEYRGALSVQKLNSADASRKDYVLHRAARGCNSFWFATEAVDDGLAKPQCLPAGGPSMGAGQSDMSDFRNHAEQSLLFVIKWFSIGPNLYFGLFPVEIHRPNMELTPERGTSAEGARRSSAGRDGRWSAGGGVTGGCTRG